MPGRLLRRPRNSLAGALAKCHSAGMPTILIIGASRGLGLEFVRQYTAGGDAVWATARSEQGMQRVRALGARAITLDVTQDDAASALTTAIGAQRFDIAILCSGA